MGDEGRTERRKEELHGAYSRATQGLWTIAALGYQLESGTYSRANLGLWTIAGSGLSAGVGANTVFHSAVGKGAP